MLSSAPKPDTRDAGNVTPERLDTNQQTTPLAYWSGRKWFNFTWIVREPKNITVTKSSGGGKGAAKGGGASSSSVYRCDVAGVMNGVGPVDFLEAIRINGKIVWSVGGGITRGLLHPEHTGDIVVPNVGTFRFHWGTETGTGDFLILNSIGEEHPFYRGFPVIEARQLQQSSGGSVANIEVLVERAPQFAGLPSDRSEEGGNPITSLAEYLENGFYGYGMTGVVKLAPAATLATALQNETQSITIDGVTRNVSLGHLSCFVSDRSSFSSFLTSVLEHFDGWARRSGDQIEFGRFTHNAIDTTGLPELTLHELAEDPKFANLGFDDPSVYTDAIVKGPDRDWDMQPSSQIGRNDVARRRLGEIRIKTYDRPFAITGFQKKLLANELAKFYAVPAGRDSVVSRREKCVGVLPGGRVIINYAPSSKREVYRVLSRNEPARGGTVDLHIELERLLSPLSFITPHDAPPTYPVPPGPVAIVYARMFQLTPEWVGGPEPTVIPLASRPSANTLGFKVWFSETDTTYDELATVTDFAIRGTVNTAAGAGDSTIRINLSGYDIAELSEQSATEQADNALLLFIGSEILSIGTVTALGGGVYDLGVLRARLGSAAAAYGAGVEAFVLRRAVAEQLQHARFPRTAATRYFKLPTKTVDEDQELADALKIAFAFADTGVGDPTAVGVVGGAQSMAISVRMPTVAADLATLELWERGSATPAPVDGDAPDFFVPAVTTPSGVLIYTRSGLPVSTTKHYWARLRDTIAGKSNIVYLGSGTTSATLATQSYVDTLIAAVNTDIAALVTETNGLAADLLAEVGAREGAIAAEASTRATADSSLNTLLTALSDEYYGNKAIVASQISTLITENSSQASSLTALFSTTGTHTSQIASLTTALASEESTRASQITTLNAWRSGIEAEVDTMIAAYVLPGGTAVATWGFKLDAFGKVVGMQAIAASGGVQSETGVIVFSGADLRTDNYVAGSSGWFMGHTGYVEFADGLWRAGFRVDTNSTTPGYSGDTNTGLAVEPGTSALFISRNDNFQLSLNRNVSNGAAAIFHRSGTQVGEIDVTTTSTSYVTSSDQRLKTDLGAFDLSEVAAPIWNLPLRKYRWRAWEESDDAATQARFAYGVFAQEVAASHEWMTRYNANEDRWGVSWEALMPNVVAALQVHHSELAALRARVAALEAN